jgi:hypothetical protein
VIARERGLSMTGFLFTTTVIIIFALVAFRVGPSYIEYFTVQKALDQTMQEVQNPTAADIRPAPKDALLRSVPSHSFGERRTRCTRSPSGSTITTRRAGTRSGPRSSRAPTTRRSSARSTITAARSWTG